MSALDDVDRFIAIVRGHDGLVNFREEGYPPELVEAAQDRLGLTFPPSYRRFLEELNGCDIEGEEFYGVWRRDEAAEFAGTAFFTLKEREAAEMPAAMIVLQEDGMGGMYVLDTASLDQDGEAQVVVFLPSWVTAGKPLEVIAPNFGAFALAKTQRAIAG